jgi:hypothetical protein
MRRLVVDGQEYFLLTEDELQLMLAKHTLHVVETLTGEKPEPPKAQPKAKRYDRDAH